MIPDFQYAETTHIRLSAQSSKLIEILKRQLLGIWFNQ